LQRRRANPYLNEGGQYARAVCFRDKAMNYLKTAMLLAGLTALFMGVGYLIGGVSGAMIALVIAARNQSVHLLELGPHGAVTLRRP
jgi:hypothetical protein